MTDSICTHTTTYEAEDLFTGELRVVCDDCGRVLS
jgi:hypothetical protein